MDGTSLWTSILILATRHPTTLPLPDGELPYLRRGREQSEIKAIIPRPSLGSGTNESRDRTKELLLQPLRGGGEKDVSFCQCNDSSNADGLLELQGEWVP